MAAAPTSTSNVVTVLIETSQRRLIARRLFPSTINPIIRARASRSDEDIRALYRTKRWRSVRLVVQRRDILCRSFGRQVRTDVDHILW